MPLQDRVCAGASHRVSAAGETAHGEQSFTAFLADRSLEVARIGLPICAADFIALAIAHHYLDSPATAAVLVPFALVVALASVVGSVMARICEPSFFSSRWVPTAVGVLAAGHVLTQLAMSGAPSDSVVVLIMILCTSLLYKLRPEAYSVTAIWVLGWLAIATYHGFGPGWLKLIPIVLVAAGLNVVMSESYRATHKKLYTLQKELGRRAQTDQLTSLPNRYAIITRIGESIQRAKRRRDHQFALCFIDLNSFKPINDQFGHGAGDSVLRAVASNLRQSCRGNDVPSRFGGDEFLVLLDDVADVEAMTRAVDRIRKACSHEVVVGANTIQVKVSAGGVWSGDGYATAEEMIKAADVVMYEDKRRAASQRASVSDRDSNAPEVQSATPAAMPHCPDHAATAQA